MTLSSSELAQAVGGQIPGLVRRYIADASGRVMVKLFDLAVSGANGIKHDGVVRSPPGVKPRWTPIYHDYR